VHNRNADIRMRERLNALRSVVGAERVSIIEANEIMEQLLGNTVYSNIFLLGYAWQQGLIPVSHAALMRAIELNAVSTGENQQAFGWGRLAAGDADYVRRAAGWRKVVESRNRWMKW
jgi:indolepyruvate ferredoxin oxidoreductase